MTAVKVRMLFFGPWDRPGHYFFNENGSKVDQPSYLPWADFEVDGKLQPGCYLQASGRWARSAEVEGVARLHQKEGWTALSFWDRSVDTRGACNSTYFAEGAFSCDEMILLASSRFSIRWSKMQFEVKPEGAL